MSFQVLGTSPPSCDVSRLKISFLQQFSPIQSSFYERPQLTLLVASEAIHHQFLFVSRPLLSIELFQACVFGFQIVPQEGFLALQRKEV